MKYVSDKEALHLIDAHDDALSAAEMILAAISALSDYDMADGDGARKLADAWLEKFKKT